MKIVNKRNHTPTDKDVYCGRGSPLGNQYRVGEHYNRFEAISYYAAWLWTQVAIEEKTVMAALRKIQFDSVLVCYCRPKPCHCEIISSVWFWLESVDYFNVKGRPKRLPERNSALGRLHR